MNINVRVLSAQAQAQIKALQAQVARLEGQLATANATAASPTGFASARGRKSLMAFGNQIQWTGRQLQYNWTLPLVLAGGAATKFALDNEKAFTRVKKVYGDTEAAAEYFNKQVGKHADAQYGATKAAKVFENELGALEGAFTALSSRYGVAQKDVLNTAGAWAAAGVEGVELAKSTELSIQAMVLGEMDLAKSTEALISIQAQYTLSTEELALALAQLNMVENSTAASMPNLIESLSRSAGAAREAGVDLRHLIAMTAALVPATGSATSAGNGLKTIISRLLSPTKDAADVMRAFGVNTADAAWQSSTAMERLTILAEHMGDSLKESADGGYVLSDSQKQVVATVLGSRYQVNRLLTLMREMNDENGYYAKALKSTASDTKVFEQAQAELNAVLESSPKRLEIMWRTIQNGMATAIQPMIPHIIWLAQSVAQLVTNFTELDPAIQKIAMISLLLLAAVGPLVRYFGSLTTLIGAMIIPFAAIWKMWRKVTDVTKEVDGVTKKTRLSFLSLFASILKAPFKPFAILAGAAFGLVSTQAAKMAAGVGKASMLAAGRFGVMIAFMTQTVMTGGLVAAFRWLWASIVATTIAGAAPVVAVFKAMWATITILFGFGARGSLLALTTLSTTSSAIVRATAVTNVTTWSAMWAGMTASAAGGVTRIRKLLLLMANPAAMIKAMQTLVRVVGAAAMRIVPALLGPWGIAIAIVGGLLWAFRDDIARIWNNVVAYFSDSTSEMVQFVLKAWNALPQGVANALVAVARIVQKVALQIYEWFSYINPFARHSPSLVENVTNGMKVVGQQFGNAASVIKGHVKGAYRDISAFGKAVASLLGRAQTFEQANQRRKIKAFAPGALAEFDQLISRLKQLQGDLAKLERQMNKQQAVVDRWAAAVERANAKLDKQQAKLDKLVATQNKWQDALSEAQDRLNYFASAPIEGMGEMSDKIFENEMAQKRLRLEMMRMEEVSGSLDDIKSRIDAINGAQELLRGEQAHMRNLGAGSEILSYYDDQIAALEATKQQQNEAAEAISNLSDELAELQRQGEILDLENSLQFDPLTRQIEQAANAMKELPFDEIMAGVQGAAADIEKYQAKLDAATAAVEKQQAVIDKLTAARDAAQARLDTEEKKLSKIKERYDEVAKAIRDVESAMSDATSAASALESATKSGKTGGSDHISPTMQNFLDAAGGNFADVGGSGSPIRTNFEDQTKLIEEFTQNITDQAAKAMGGIDMFGPIKKKWAGFKGWLGSAWSSFTSALNDMFSNIFGSESGQSAITGFKSMISGLIDWITGVGSKIGDALKIIWDFIGPSVVEAAKNTWLGLVDAFKSIGSALKESLGPALKNIGPALDGVKNIILLIAAVLAPVVALIVKLLVNIWAKGIRPLLAGLGKLLAGAIDIFGGLIDIVLGFFMLFSKGNFQEGLKTMGKGVIKIFEGLIKGIFGVLQAGWGVIKGVVWGVIDGVIDAFKWLFKVIVGNSIVPDMVKLIVVWFKKLGAIIAWVWNNFAVPVINAFKKLFGLVVAGLKLWWAGVTLAWTILATVSVWVWDNILKPVLDVFVELGKLVFAGLKLWWNSVKTAWNGLKAAGGWIWNNVLKPVFNKFKEVWDKYIVPSLRLWWQGVKNIWAALRAAGGWIWENVLKPVLQRFKNLWSNVRESLAGWWNGIKTVWNSLKGLGGWVKEHVMDPVVDKIKSAWRSVKDWLNDNKSMLTKPVNAIVNTVVKAVNTIIKGLNKVGKILPGKGWNIDLIPELATGGEMPARRAARGFKTAGARAIVGEGKANHPEFVIPTDPTYRKRAQSLLAEAANRIGVSSVNKKLENAPLGAHDVREYAMGGWLTDRIDNIKGVGKKLKDIGKGAIGKIMNPLYDAADRKISSVNWDPAEIPPEWAIGKLRSWTSNADSQLNAGKDKYSTPAGGDVPVTDPANPKGRSNFRGGNFSNLFIAHLKKAEELSNATIRVMQGGFRPATSYSGTSHQGDALDAQASAALIRGLRRVGIAAGDRTGLGNWASHLHAVPGPDSGYAAGSAPWQWNDYVAKGGKAQALNSAWGLKEGGIALARKGPTLAAIGDGRYDEAVVPLPRGWRSGGLIGTSEESKTIHFHGDLSFPNITDPDDAQKFLDNLDNLTKD